MSDAGVQGAAIEVRQLVKQYKDVEAVSDLTMSVARGSIHCLLGRNGSGKTTTLRMMLGLCAPSSGSVRVLGMEYADNRNAILARTGFVCGRPLLEWMTGNELLRLTSGFYPSWSHERAKRYSDLLEVPLKKKFRKMSRGTQTKMWLLLALAQSPDLLVLDEPTAGLDPVITDVLLRVLVDEFASEGRTVLLSSHHISEVERVADRVSILDRGKLLFEADIEEMRSSFRRIQAAGNGLPTGGDDVLRVRNSHGSTEYVVRRNANAFASELAQGGATVLANTPMNLSEVFLEFVREE